MQNITIYELKEIFDFFDLSKTRNSRHSQLDWESHFISFLSGQTSVIYFDGIPACAGMTIFLQLLIIQRIRDCFALHQCGMTVVLLALQMP